MGKGDVKTKKGKLWRGSFGKRRPHKKTKASGGVKLDFEPVDVKKEMEVTQKEEIKGKQRKVAAKKTSRKRSSEKG